MKSKDDRRQTFVVRSFPAIELVVTCDTRTHILTHTRTTYALAAEHMTMLEVDVLLQKVKVI